MPREFQRSDRVADAIQRSLAQTIPREVRDPRVGMTNINSVDVTRDMSLAKVFVTFVGASDDDENEAGVKVLNNAASYLRNFIARDLRMRTIPRIEFHYDRVAVHGQALSNLIDRAVAADGSNEKADSE